MLKGTGWVLRHWAEFSSSYFSFLAWTALDNERRAVTSWGNSGICRRHGGRSGRHHQRSKAGDKWQRVRNPHHRRAAVTAASLDARRMTSRPALGLVPPSTSDEYRRRRSWTELFTQLSSFIDTRLDFYRWDWNSIRLLFCNFVSRTK